MLSPFQVMVPSAKRAKVNGQQVSIFRELWTAETLWHHPPRSVHSKTIGNSCWCSTRTKGLGGVCEPLRHGRCTAQVSVHHQRSGGSLWWTSIGPLQMKPLIVLSWRVKLVWTRAGLRFCLWCHVCVTSQQWLLSSVTQHLDLSRSTLVRPIPCFRDDTVGIQLVVFLLSTITPNTGANSIFLLLSVFVHFSAALVGGSRSATLYYFPSLSLHPSDTDGGNVCGARRLQRPPRLFALGCSRLRTIPSGFIYVRLCSFNLQVWAGIKCFRSKCMKSARLYPLSAAVFL